MEVEHVLDDEWSAAALAFQHGARDRSSSALRNALDKTPLECALQRMILHVNEHATQISPSQTNPPPTPPQLFVPNGSPHALQLLASETALTAAYNTALVLLRTGKPLPGASVLDRALARVPDVLVSAYGGKRHKSFRRKYNWEDITSLANAARLDEELFSSLPQKLSTSARRWAEAAAAAFELRGAAALCLRDVDSTAIVAEAARALRGLAVAELARSSAKHYGEPNAVPPEAIAASDGYKSQFQGKAPEETERIASLQQDDDAARADWLVALAGGLSGSWETALEAILDRGREAEPSKTGDTTGSCHLPSAYVAGALLVIGGGSAETKETAVRMLETCAARGYRTADSLALIARLRCGSKGISAWQSVVALDFQRRAALWLAAKEFGACGRVAQQAELLRCLIEVLSLQNSDGPRQTQTENRVGLVTMEQGLRTSSQLTKGQVSLAHASALCSSEQWEQATAVLANVHTGNSVDVEAEANDVEEDIGAVTGTLAAWAAIGTGDIEGGIKRAEAVVDMYGNDGVWAACAHAGRAEALLRVERMQETCEALLGSFRAGNGVFGKDEAESMLLRGVCFHNLGVARYCLAKEAIADECFAAAQAAFEKCEARSTREGVQELGKRFAMCASFSRCIAMWARGRKVDAAAHWIAKRELHANDGNKQIKDIMKPQTKTRAIRSHVMGDVDEASLKKMDEVCAQVCRGEEARRRLSTMMEELQREWPFRQNG